MVLEKQTAFIDKLIQATQDTTNRDTILDVVRLDKIKEFVYKPSEQDTTVECIKPCLTTQDTRIHNWLASFDQIVLIVVFTGSDHLVYKRLSVFLNQRPMKKCKHS